MQQLKFRAQDYNIIGIVETHANKNINDAELSLEGFNLYHLDRQDKRGGGLVIYVNGRLKSSLCTDIYSAFSALTLLVGRQEGHPACKKE